MAFQRQPLFSHDKAGATDGTGVNEPDPLWRWRRKPKLALACDWTTGRGPAHHTIQCPESVASVFFTSSRCPPSLMGGESGMHATRCDAPVPPVCATAAVDLIRRSSLLLITASSPWTRCEQPLMPNKASPVRAWALALPVSLAPPSKCCTALTH
jgi:hypothetical protein